MDIPIEKKKFNTKKILSLVVVLGLAIFLVAMIRSTGGSSTLKISEDRIRIFEVKEGIFQENIPVSGVVLPISTIYLDALEGGRVEEIFVEDGTVMKKGDPILRLSNTDLELSLVNQETSVYNLLTQMQISQNAARQNTINRLNQKTDVDNAFKEAKRIFEMNKELYKKGVIARQTFTASKNDYEYQAERQQLAKEIIKEDSLATRQELKQAQSSYARTQSALELMRKKVSDLIVRAPVDGQLTSMDAQIGQSKHKSERLGQLDILSGFKVRVPIDEYYISRIYAGQKGLYQVNNKKYTLEIKKVYTQVVNGRFEVDMVFVNEVPERIRRGQSLQIKIALSDEKQSVLLQKGGFFQRTGGNWIFKIDKDENTAYKTEIKLGTQNTEYYEVVEGLNPGDKVITSSYETYNDIEKIVIE